MVGMPDREKVIAGLTMLADSKNDDTCEGLKCFKIAEDALALLKEQEKEIENLKEIIRKADCSLEIVKERLNELLYEDFRRVDE